MVSDTMVMVVVMTNILVIMGDEYRDNDNKNYSYKTYFDVSS